MSGGATYLVEVIRPSVVFYINMSARSHPAVEAGHPFLDFDTLRDVGRALHRHPLRYSHVLPLPDGGGAGHGLRHAHQYRGPVRDGHGHGDKASHRHVHLNALHHLLLHCYSSQYIFFFLSIHTTFSIIRQSRFFIIFFLHWYYSEFI